MPLYEYRCEACAQTFESYRRLSEGDKAEKCPACGGAAKKVQISLVNAGSGSGEPAGRACGGGGRRRPFR